MHSEGNGAAAMKSITSSSAATRRGDAMLAASGMKISAEPKPENPRAVPETKAIAQIAIAAARLDIRRDEAGEAHPRDMGLHLIRNARCGARNHARKLPPVFLVTSATILAPTASIS